MQISASPKISVVGCGYWGKNLIRNLFELKVLHSVCDHQVDRAKEFADKFDALVLDFDNILTSDCDAVFIATQPENHFELAKLCLQSEKHIFVEKPLTLSVQESLILCDLAKQKNYGWSYFKLSPCFFKNERNSSKK